MTRPMRGGGPRRPTACRGSATVTALALLGVLLSVAGAVALGSAVLVDHRRAESAADLAALAGAGAAGRGEDGCAAAASVAGDNGVDLVACEVLGRDVRVRVERRREYVAGLTARLVAEARAGPAG